MSWASEPSSQTLSIDRSAIEDGERVVRGRKNKNKILAAAGGQQQHVPGVGLCALAGGAAVPGAAAGGLPEAVAARAAAAVAAQPQGVHRQSAPGLRQRRPRAAGRPETTRRRRGTSSSSSSSKLKVWQRCG